MPKARQSLSDSLLDYYLIYGHHNTRILLALGENEAIISIGTISRVNSHVSLHYVVYNSNISPFLFTYIVGRGKGRVDASIAAEHDRHMTCYG